MRLAGASLAYVLLVTACTQSAEDAGLEANKELVRQFTAATNAADWDALSDIVAEDLVRHSAATDGPPVRSLEEFVALQESFLVSFPDQRVTIDQMVAEGDRVAIRAVYRGTHTGPLGNFPATGESVEAPFLAILRIEEGKIAEMWVEWDNLAMLEQLGLLPEPEPI